MKKTQILGLIITILITTFIFMPGVIANNNIPPPNQGGLGAETENIGAATCDGVLGRFGDDLRGVLRIIRIVAPLMVIGFGTFDYLTAIFSKDAEALKKSNEKLVKRLVLVAILFFLPTILNLLLGVIDVQTCVYLTQAEGMINL